MRTPERVGRIAVLRANALGDLILTYPALQALKDRFPEAELTLIGKAWHAEFLAGRPGPVDRVAVLPVPEVLGGPISGEAAARLAPWLEEQRARRYDVAVQLYGGGRFSNPLTASLGAALTVGLRAPDAPGLDADLPYIYYQHETVRGLEVVGLLGASGVPYPAVAVTDADRGAAEAALRGRVRGAYAVLHPGATDARRRWPPERFAAVADHLRSLGLDVLATGTLAERDVTGAVAAEAASDVVDLAGRLSLPALVGVLAGAEILISNDTGPMHLADAVGTPTVGIFWCGNAINAAPLRRRRHRPLLSWTIHCPQCGANCTRDVYPSRTAGDACKHKPSFVAEVPVVEVVDAAEDLLAGARPVTAAPWRQEHQADPEAVGSPSAS